MNRQSLRHQRSSEISEEIDTEIMQRYGNDSFWIENAMIRLQALLEPSTQNKTFQTPVAQGKNLRVILRSSLTIIHHI